MFPFPGGFGPGVPIAGFSAPIEIFGSSEGDATAQVRPSPLRHSWKKKKESPRGAPPPLDKKSGLS